MNRYGLSKREAQVLKLLLEGKSNKQIAAILGISESTVEAHLTSIYTKAGVSSRVELILRSGQPGIAQDNIEPEKVGESTGENLEKPGETPDEKFARNVYDREEQISPAKGSRVVGERASSFRINSILVFLGIILAFLAFIVLYLYLSLPKSWEGYERECEYPDESTVGQTIGRSNASGDQVHGQFGAMAVEPWSGMAGEVVYKNISTPRVEELYLQIRYSKNSPPSAPILVYLDGEESPRASVYPQDQKEWDRFAWSDPIYLGSVESGVHSITFSSVGQQYGVADLDKFVLTAGSP
jgi:DNA-binding CsgD family transcriptional regulator